MRQIVRTSVVVLAVAALMTAGSVAAWGQSGNKTLPPGSTQRYPAAQRSQQSPQRMLQVALEGYCPVTIRDARKWVKGNPVHRAFYDDREYHFASPIHRQKFEADPRKYVPALRGDCTVSFAKLGKRVPGRVHHTVFHDGRLFLFVDQRAKNMFTSDPGAYADVDLALGGHCPVCLMDQKVMVAGKPELTVHYEGFRYLFPGIEQQEKFLADPEKYKVRPGVQTEPPEGSGPRVPPI